MAAGPQLLLGQKTFFCQLIRVQLQCRNSYQTIWKIFIIGHYNTWISTIKEEIKGMSVKKKSAEEQTEAVTV